MNVTKANVSDRHCRNVAQPPPAVSSAGEAPAATSVGRGDPPRCAAMTLVEAVVSIAIVGVMLVAALNAVGASRVTQQKMSERARAMLLAEDLMSEILRQAYEDPDLGAGSFGLAGSEIGDGSRALWEDVDDYDGWSAAPPEEKDGTPLNGFAGWTRSVEVAWIATDDFEDEQGSDTGVKRVIVRVVLNDALMAELTALRTNVYQYGPEEL